MVSVISTIHVIDFFKLSNPTWLAVSLAIAFEVGAAASLASLIALQKMNKSLVWMLFFLLTAMQAMGNTYYAYVNLKDFTAWSELFGLIEEEVIFQKRVLSIVSGAILPIVALGFIKSLVDYIKPEETQETSVEESPEGIVEDPEQEKLEDISEPLVFNEDLQMLHETVLDAGEAEENSDVVEEVPVISAENEITYPVSEFENVNSNRRVTQRVQMPTNTDINPTKL